MALSARSERRRILPWRTLDANRRDWSGTAIGDLRWLVKFKVSESQERRCKRGGGYRV